MRSHSALEKINGLLTFRGRLFSRYADHGRYELLARTARFRCLGADILCFGV